MNPKGFLALNTLENIARLIFVETRCCYLNENSLNLNEIYNFIIISKLLLVLVGFETVKMIVINTKIFEYKTKIDVGLYDLITNIENILRLLICLQDGSNNRKCCEDFFTYILRYDIVFI